MTEGRSRGSDVECCYGYAPQVGCEGGDKGFCEDMDAVIDSIPREEKVLIGANLNEHVEGKGNRGNCAKKMEVGTVNTHFQKTDDHRMNTDTPCRKVKIKAEDRNNIILHPSYLLNLFTIFITTTLSEKALSQRNFRLQKISSMKYANM